MSGAFDFQPQTRVISGAGSFRQLSGLAASLGFRRTLIVADAGLLQTGYPAHAAADLSAEGIDCRLFHDFSINPDSDMVERGRIAAADAAIDSLIGLGGGSSMDCAKAINFVLTNGGHIGDYAGYGRASRPLLPMIGVPTTTGTGSEAQSYAVITDSATHRKMACGDPKAAFRIAVLDPELVVTQPMAVRAITGFDAISHAVESYVSTRRNAISAMFSREAWRLLDGAFERLLTAPDDMEAAAAMQTGAHFAGAAIENSMLGAAHACANPLTMQYGITHGLAIAMMLPHVVRWNMTAAGALYRDLAPDLPERLAVLASHASAAAALDTIASFPESDLPLLSAEAAAQWTGRFNPRPFDEAGAMEIYRCALPLTS